MKNKILLPLLIMFLSVIGYSQDYGAAILLNKDAVYGKYETMVMESFKTNYDKKQPNYTEFYTWNRKDDKLLRYEKFIDSAAIEMPITKMVDMNTLFKASEQVEESFKVDTSGKVTDMYLDLKIEERGNYRIIDVTTSEVLKSEKIENYSKRSKGTSKKAKTQLVVDIKKYFGRSDPKKYKKSNPKGYRAKLIEIKKDYKKEIQNNLRLRAEDFGKSLSYVASKLKALGDKRLWKVKDGYTLSDKGKLKQFYIDATSAENIGKNEMVDVYQKEVYGTMDGYRALTSVFVEEVAEDKVLVKTSIFGRKKLKKAMESDADLVFCRNSDLVKQQNKKDDKEKRVQIKGNITALTGILLRVPALKLIDRSYSEQLKYFSDQYTDEKFIDFPMEQLQGKQQGVDYVFENTSSGVKATEVATGRIEMLDQQKKKGMLGSMIEAGSGAKLVNLCMEILDEGIQIIEVTDQKKGKVKKALVYSALGMEGMGTLNMFRLIEEKVGDRTITREEEIGKAWIKGRKTDNIAEIKIKKGNKELFQALENNERIKFKVKF